MEKFTIRKINEDIETPVDHALMSLPNEDMLSNKSIEIGITKSEPAKFVSKIFEARQMAHVFHLQTDSYSKHMALDAFYKDILKLNDSLIETYSGQYEIIENYEMIEGEPTDNCIEYFIELADFIKNTRYKAFLEEDTHLHNIIDEMVSLIYKTLYKLKNLK